LTRLSANELMSTAGTVSSSANINSTCRTRSSDSLLPASGSQLLSRLCSQNH
jgi:hypothetical protein